MDRPLFSQPQKPRSLGILNRDRSQQLDAARFGGVENGQPQAFKPRPDVVAAPVLARPALAAPRPMAGSAPRLALARAPMPGDYEPGSFGEQNANASAGVTTPGSFAAQNAQANGTGAAPPKAPPPPQQTERANPLTGDNNVPPESVTTRVQPAPFIQRGRGTPQGQDTTPAPIATTETEDSDIGKSLNGTLGRIGGAYTGGAGAFARKFNDAKSAADYTGYTRRLFQQPTGN